MIRLSCLLLAIATVVPGTHRLHASPAAVTAADVFASLDPALLVADEPMSAAQQAALLDTGLRVDDNACVPAAGGAPWYVEKNDIEYIQFRRCGGSAVQLRLYPTAYGNRIATVVSIPDESDGQQGFAFYELDDGLQVITTLSAGDVDFDTLRDNDFLEDWSLPFGDHENEIALCQMQDTGDVRCVPTTLTDEKWNTGHRYVAFDVLMRWIPLPQGVGGYFLDEKIQLELPFDDDAIIVH